MATISNTARILQYFPFANRVYGSNTSPAPQPTDNATIVAVDGFRASSTSFQSALYKTNDGKYVIAIRGSDDGGDWTGPNVGLAAANAAKLAERVVGVIDGVWDPQMTDAVTFAYRAFQTIRAEFIRENPNTTPSFDQLRALVTTTGHSLGGALAELIAKTFGIGGANIDGPGIAGLLDRPELAGLKAQIRADFPELQNDYTLTPSQFGAYAYSMIGVAATHVYGIEYQSTNKAEATARYVRAQMQ
jgi:Lipase (class 3)